MKADVPGAALLHPVALGAIALLIANDHVLKAAFPSVLTGKLSDFAGMLFFPAMLQSAAEWLRLAPWGDRRVAWACAALTALGFGVVKTWPPAGAAFGTISDPTDLVALPGVLFTPWLARPPAADPVRVARLRTLITSGRAGEHRADRVAWVRRMAHELATDEDEVAFLLSAIGSYTVRASVLAGVNPRYDADHRAVFLALDQLAAEGVHPGEENGRSVRGVEGHTPATSG